MACIVLTVTMLYSQGNVFSIDSFYKSVQFKGQDDRTIFNMLFELLNIVSKTRNITFALTSL